MTDQTGASKCKYTSHMEGTVLTYNAGLNADFDRVPDTEYMPDHNTPRSPDSVPEATERVRAARRDLCQA